jgi:aminopeptidase N
VSFVRLVFFAIGFFIALPVVAAQPVVSYTLAVQLDPRDGSLAVRATLHLPTEVATRETLTVMLHAGLAPHLEGPKGARLEPLAHLGGVSRFESYRLRLPPGTERVILHYAGTLAFPRMPGLHPGEADSGPLSRRGVQLGEASGWYPLIPDTRQRFVLDVTLPAQWRSVSQGVRERSEVEEGRRLERWHEQSPQREITLVAGPFYEYSQKTDGFTAYAFLREDDPALAQRYLAVTAEYVAFYSRLLGPYPYEKFAVVENFWESGLGLPSYTLLGPRVLRLPFILHSSYPHEILHNWWGNGVYIDYAGGNWGEGLTSYLADHLMRERDGEAEAYRHQALQRYSHYAIGGRDFALREFRVRHSETAQAVGYDKTLMLFHMLRRRLGDEDFLGGLRRLYRDHLFQTAGFDDVRRALEAASGSDLTGEFAQWVDRAGAPALQVAELRSETRAEGGYRLHGIVRQVQEGPPFSLQVPLAVQLEGETLAWETQLTITGREQAFELTLPARPWRLYVDRHNDVMRRLDPLESPPVFSRLFGAERVLWVLPGSAPAHLREAYRAMAGMLVSEGKVEIRGDDELAALPADRAIWLLGWENRWRDALEGALQAHGVIVDRQGGVRLPDDERVERTSEAVVLVMRHPASAEQVVGWLAFDHVEALPALARRLRHYGSYGYLLFSGEEARNRLAGRWPRVDSPLWLDIAQPDGAQPPATHAVLRARPWLGTLAD